MNCGGENKNCGCITDVLEKILTLQKQDFDNEIYAGCDKPFLGPVCTTVCYNTRPITLYNCCTGSPWSFPYTQNDSTGFSTIFRVESLDDCCCTCRILALNDDGSYFNTNEFFTIDLNCVGAIKCLPDSFVELC